MSEEEGVTGNKGSGGPDAKERASNANKSSSDEEETRAFLTSYYHCSGGWISFEGGGTIQSDDLNGLLGRGKKSRDKWLSNLFIYLTSPHWNTLFIHEYIKIIRQGDHYSLTNYSGSLVN